MTPHVNARTAAEAAFVISGMPPEQRRHVFAQTIEAILNWGLTQGWSREQCADFAQRFGQCVIDHWPPKEGRPQ